jgi:uncharacterized protein YaeQ
VLFLFWTDERSKRRRAANFSALEIPKPSSADISEVTKRFMRVFWVIGQGKTAGCLGVAME